jgi:hypothetical protein
MTDEKVLEVVQKIREIIRSRYPDLQSFRHKQLKLNSPGPTHKAMACEHLLHCCTEIPEMLKEDKEKAMRWLGFVQGALWSLFGMSVEELAEMNRPADATVRG